MIAIEKIEGKDQNLLLQNINTDEVHYKFNEIPSKLFKSKRTELIYISKKFNYFITTKKVKKNLNFIYLNYR